MVGSYFLEDTRPSSRRRHFTCYPFGLLGKARFEGNRAWNLEADRSDIIDVITLTFVVHASERSGTVDLDL